MPRPCKHPKRETWDRIAELTKLGWSYPRIGRELGYSGAHVAQIAHEMGFRRRRLAEPIIFETYLIDDDRETKIAPKSD